MGMDIVTDEVFFAMIGLKFQALHRIAQSFNMFLLLTHALLHTCSKEWNEKIIGMQM